MCGIIQAEGKKRALSLEEMMNEEDKSLKSILSSFSCTYDEDIQNFLHDRAIEFERLLKSRTYLGVIKSGYDKIINNLYERNNQKWQRVRLTGR